VSETANSLDSNAHRVCVNIERRREEKLTERDVYFFAPFANGIGSLGKDLPPTTPGANHETKHTQFHVPVPGLICARYQSSPLPFADHITSTGT